MLSYRSPLGPCEVYDPAPNPVKSIDTNILDAQILVFNSIILYLLHYF